MLRFARVVFGVSSSPFLLNAIARYHLESHVDTHQEFVEKILRSIYVVSGAPSEGEKYTIQKVAQDINLRTLSSNSTSFN